MNQLTKKIMERVAKAKENGKPFVTVRIDTVKKLIQSNSYKSIQCDYSYTDDYAWDAANDYGKGQLSHTGALQVAERYLDGKGTRCYISVSNPDQVSISPYSNLSYTLFLETEEQTPAKPESKVNTQIEVKATSKPAITCEMNLNNDLNGVELKFSGVPTEAVRNELKEMGFRWSKYNKVWYSKQTEKTILFAESLVSIYADIKADQEREEQQEETQPEATETAVNIEETLTGRKVFGNWGVMSGFDYGIITGGSIGGYGDEVVIEWEEGHTQSVYKKDIVIVEEGTNLDAVGVYLLPEEQQTDDNSDNTEEQPQQAEYTTEGKIEVKTIQFVWSESGDIQDELTVNTFQEAEQLIKKAAKNAPDNGAYDKTKFLITWSDGQTYEGRIDIIYSDMFKAQPLKDHIQSFANYVINSKESFYSEEDKQGYKEFLETYTLEDQTQSEEEQKADNSKVTKVLDFNSRFKQKQEQQEQEKLYDQFLNTILPYMTPEEQLEMVEVYKTDDNTKIGVFFDKIALKTAVRRAKEEMKVK